MKCPFRTVTTQKIKKTVNFYGIEQNEHKTIVEFSDCLEKECPFYIELSKLLYDDKSQSFGRKTEPHCERAKSC